MLLVLITFTLIAIGIVSFAAGAWMISRYAFRISSGTGVGVLLFPPYTFWFAFFQLEQEGKEIPIATWLFGLVSTALLLFVFWQPVNTVFTDGFSAAAAQYSGIGESASDEYGAKEPKATTKKAPVEKVEEPAEEPAPAETTPNADAGNSADAAANDGTTADGQTAPAADGATTP